MSRARAVVVALILLLLAAAPEGAAALSLGGLLDPVLEPLEPVTEAAGDLLAPITEPTGQLVDPLVGPVVELLEPVTDPLLEPVEDLLAPVTDPLLEPVEEALAPVTDPLLEPVEEALAPVTDPLLGPVEEVVDPITDPVDGVVDPLINPDPQPEGGNPPGSSDPAIDGGSVISVPSLGSFESQPTSAAVSFVSSAISLLPPRSGGVVVSPSVAQSLLSQILDWLSGFDAGSFLAAPFLGLRVLLRALASAGQGLLIPGMMLVVLALMARDRRILGTKTP
ncbi:MAG: hypothetical protein WD354_09825 [Acidimicrobiia bacterium]